MEQESSGRSRFSWVINIVIVCAFVITAVIVLQKSNDEQEGEADVVANVVATPRPTKILTPTPTATQSPTVEPTEIVEPTPTITEEPTATAVPTQFCRPPSGWVLRTFEPDVSLETILEENGLSMAELLQGNCLTEETISSFDKLFLPPPPPTATPTPLPETLPTSLPENSVLGSLWRRPSDDMLMLYVPGGTFMMGSDPEVDIYAGDDEMPLHQVTLDSF